jgi:hypothetical protein
MAGHAQGLPTPDELRGRTFGNGVKDADFLGMGQKADWAVLEGGVGRQGGGSPPAFGAFRDVACLQLGMPDRLLAEPRGQPVHQLRQVQVILDRPVQPGLDCAKGFHHPGIQGDQVKAEAGVMARSIALTSPSVW